MQASFLAASAYLNKFVAPVYRSLRTGVQIGTLYNAQSTIQATIEETPLRISSGRTKGELLADPKVIQEVTRLEAELAKQRKDANYLRMRAALLNEELVASRDRAKENMATSFDIREIGKSVILTLSNKSVFRLVEAGLATLNFVAAIEALRAKKASLGADQEIRSEELLYAAAPALLTILAGFVGAGFDYLQNKYNYYKLNSLGQVLELGGRVVAAMLNPQGVMPWGAMAGGLLEISSGTLNKSANIVEEVRTELDAATVGDYFNNLPDEQEVSDLEVDEQDVSDQEVDRQETGSPSSLRRRSGASSASKSR